MVLFDTDAVYARLTSRYIGREIHFKQSTGTTMDDAAQGAKQGRGHGTAYVADVQTNARGSKGRSWNAVSSGNIYVSFIIHRNAVDGVATPERHFEHDLELAASLSAMEVIGEHGVTGVKVKWLNDLWIKGHKILGALAEFKGLIQVKGASKYLYILGVGLNLNSDMRHVTELSGLATSSLCETGRLLQREEIFADLCSRLDVNLTKNRADLMELYQKNAAFSVDTDLKVYFTNTSLKSKVCSYQGVDVNWAIKLKDKDGALFTAPITEVSVRPVQQQAVYVLSGEGVVDWSCRLLMKTCTSLLDTVKYDVRSVTMTALLNGGIPRDCALLVIGQLCELLPSSSFVKIVRSHVQTGGTCWCLSNGCYLFLDTSCTDSNAYQLQPVSLTVYGLTPGTSETTQESVACLSGIKLTLGNSRLVEEAGLEIIANYPINESTDIDTHMDHAVKKRVDESKVKGLPRNSAVVVVSSGEGLVCLCEPQLEVSYADIRDFFPEIQHLEENLHSTFFQRDFLVQRIFDYLKL